MQFTTSEFRLADSADTSKQTAFNNAGQSPGVIRTLSTQDKDYTLAGLDDLQVSVADIVADFQLALSSTFPANALIRLQNRSGSDWLITTTGADTIEGGTSFDLFDGETLDLTIQGNDFRA